jgi:hypothetical protein
MLGGNDERLDAEEMLASDESQAEDVLTEESVDEVVQRFRWQL